MVIPANAEMTISPFFDFLGILPISTKRETAVAAGVTNEVWGWDAILSYGTSAPSLFFFANSNVQVPESPS